jgi:hypothetical protein
MRTLKFIVDGKTIRQDPASDFNGLFPGRNNDVRAVFDFSPEWNGKIKVAAFWSMFNIEYPPQRLDDDNSCIIPVEALNRPAFKVQVMSKIKGSLVETNQLTIYQRGGTV